MATRTSSARLTAKEAEILAAALRGESLLDALRCLPFQFSGRYEFNGGVPETRAAGLENGSLGPALRNPIYKLDEPIFLNENLSSVAERRGDADIRFTLHVDVDGTDPLGVVSGTVASSVQVPGAPTLHFVGRVTADTTTVGGRALVVDDFKLAWPESIDTITRLKITLSGSPLVTPTAEVTFVDTALTHEHGPFTSAQVSSFFRCVEMDVDREDGAVDVEPVSTHVHPDRPAGLPEEELTLEGAFEKAGIQITRSNDANTLIDTSAAGANKRWSFSELHDAMQDHWEAFANRPQWKMWVFLAELADSDSLGGVMFDGDIDEPGGVDRQGTAIFTLCPFFHTERGGYIVSNPPVAEAVKRELFNLIHEVGHAFNLAHSFQKHLGGPWEAPSWMPLVTNAQALSWMNYPDAATPGAGAGTNATWFYKRFGFRFDKGELLFLRHAPERFVEMGAEVWFTNHGRVSRQSVDQRLRLDVRSLKPIVEYGEPVMAELRLMNVSGAPVFAHQNLAPSDGLVEIAITNPAGERRPFLPIDHTRSALKLQPLDAGAKVYEAIDLTMGSFGFPFKEPGAYRIEASYTNVDGGTAAAVMQVYVRPPRAYDALPTVHELFDARVGAALYVDGTRTQGQVIETIDRVRQRLDEQLGPANPISSHLTAARYLPLATPSKTIAPGSNKVTVLPEEPDRVVEALRPVVEAPADTADTFGHIWYREVVDTYVQAAEDAKENALAVEAQGQMVSLFQSRGVIAPVVEQAEERLEELPGDVGPAATRGSRSTKERAGCPDGALVVGVGARDSAARFVMEWKLDTLLSLVPRESDREELRGLGRRHQEAVLARASADEREAIVDEAMARVQDHFRALRHPLPTRADLEQMLSEPEP